MPYKVVLASQSPRRKQILESLHIDFEIRNQAMDESFPESMALDKVPEFLAKKKANGMLENMGDNELIITADTVVLIGDKILNKPAHREEAHMMLSLLSGNMHKVVTGVCLTSKNHQFCFSDTTKVYFRKLEKDEIDFYIHQYQPYDKAGAYAIQEWIGLVGIEKIEGSYFNVVGLPVEKLYSALKDFGIQYRQ